MEPAVCRDGVNVAGEVGCVVLGLLGLGVGKAKVSSIIGDQGIVKRAPDRTAPGEKPKGGGLSARAIPAFLIGRRQFCASPLNSFFGVVERCLGSACEALVGLENGPVGYQND
jgi:hypothetical protein